MRIHNIFNKDQVSPIVDFLKEIQNPKEYVGVLLKFKNGNVLTCFNIEDDNIDDNKNLSCFNYNTSKDLTKSIVNNITSTTGQMLAISIAAAGSIIKFTNMDNNLSEVINESNKTIDININQNKNENTSVNKFVNTAAIVYPIGFIVLATLKHLIYVNEKSKTYISLQGKEEMPLFISEEYKDKYFHYNSKTQELSYYNDWLSYRTPSLIYNLYDKNANQTVNLIPQDVSVKFTQHHKVFSKNKNVENNNDQTIHSESSHDSGIALGSRI